MANLERTIHIGDYGTIFDVALEDSGEALDPATFTSGSFIFRRPDQTTFERSSGSAIFSSGSYFRYTTVEGDINQTGTWTLQVYVEDGAGLFHTDFVEFVVHPNLE